MHGKGIGEEDREKKQAARTGNKDEEQTTVKDDTDRQKESSKSTLRVEKI